MVTWSPLIHDGVAETDTALSAASTTVVSCIVSRDAVIGGMRGGEEGVVVAASLPP